MKIKLTTKERLLNFRTFFISAIFVLISVYCSLITLSIAWLGILLFCLNLLICGILGIFYFKKRFKNGSFKFITFIICTVLSCSAFFSFIIIEKNWSNEINGRANIYGMIEKDVTYNGFRYLILSNVKLNDKNISGKVQLNVTESYGESNLESGTLIDLNADVVNVDLVDGFDVDGYSFRNNIRYVASVEVINSNDIAGKINAGLFIKLREAIYARLNRGMGEKNGAIAYGMIVGDKTYIDSDVVNYFTVAGIRHLLAVSGLHLGIICTFLTAILLHYYINRKIIASANALIIVFYMFLAGFSPSVLRSAIMSGVGVYFFLSGEDRDMLNSLGFAFTVILSFAPFFLFEVGFLLSVCCIFSLALFSEPISTFLIDRLFKIKSLPDTSMTRAKRRKFLKRANRKRKIIRLFSTTFAIQLGVFPVCVYFFKSFQVYSFFVNLIVVPLIGTLFLTLILSLIFSFITTLDFGLFICGYGINGLDFIASSVAKLPFASVLLFSTKLIFICYLLYFTMSGFVIKRKKVLISLLCIAQCVMLLVIQNSPALLNNSLAIIQYPYSNVSVLNIENENYIIGDFWSGSSIYNRILNLRIRSIKGIFVNKLDDNVALQLIIFSKAFNDIDVYYPIELSTSSARSSIKNESKISLIPFENKNSLLEAERIELNDDFHALYQDNKFCGYGFIKENASILFVPHRNLYYNIRDIFRYNIVRVSNFNDYNIDDIDALFLVNSFEVQPEYINKYENKVISYTKFNDYAFNFKDGQVYKPN